jgi:hypothetical protein
VRRWRGMIAWRWPRLHSIGNQGLGIYEPGPHYLTLPA